MSVWAIVPARALADGKSRLASVLSPTERAWLNETFFRRTLDVVAAVVGPHRTLTVTRSTELRRMARSMGIGALAERGAGGLNEALAQAAAEVGRRGATAVLSVSCDLPLLSAKDLHEMLRTAGRNAVVIASDRAGVGTNAMLISPVGIIPYSHGVDSYRKHVEAARRMGLPIQAVHRIGLAFDIDTPADLKEHLAAHTAALVSEAKLLLARSRTERNVGLFAVPLFVHEAVTCDSSRAPTHRR